MDNQLNTTTSGNQSQATTQSPQLTGRPATNSTQSGSVQPGTTSSLLESSNGISLGDGKLTAVSLKPSSLATSSAKDVGNKPAQHDFNPAYLALPVLLVIVAVVIVIVTNRSVKKTT